MSTITIPRNELKYLPVPAATDTFQPVPHSEALDICQRQLYYAGFDVREERITVSESGSTMACQWIIRNGTDHPIENYRPQVIVLNDHSKKFRLRVGFGLQCIICLNGMFGAERQVGRKHTPRIFEDLPDLVSEAIMGSSNWFEDQLQFLIYLKSIKPARTDINDLLVIAAEQGVISSSMIMRVLSIFKEPTYEDYGRDSLYTLHSGFTQVLKSVNPITLPQRTIKLDTLFKQLAFEGSLSTT